MLAALIALGLVWLAPQDPFVAQREAAAARNKGSARFTIAFAAGERRAFRPGEPIPVVLSYDNVDGESPQHVDRLSQTVPIRVFADPMDGVAAPLVDLERARIYPPRGICCGVRGALGGGTAGRTVGLRWDGTQAVPIPAPPPPPPPPITGTLVLNQIARFDAPGHYRIYLTDGHSGEIAYSMGWPPGAPLVSNILELEITARDPQWEEQTASNAIAILASSSEAKDRTAAARTLRFLGTDRAVGEMVHRLSHMPDDEKSREDSAEYVRGVFGARDRGQAISRLEAVLDDATQPVGWLHFVTLAALRLSASAPPGPFDPARKRAAYNVVAATRNRALHKAGTLVNGLAAAFEDYAPVPEGIERPPRHGIRAALSRSIAEFPRDVEIALRRVAPSTQRAVLENARDSFLDRRLAPMLTRLAGVAGADGVAEASVSLLNDIAPSAARRIILADLARPTPRFAIATARLLPDRTLPALDRVFLAQLTAARDLDESSRAMDSIARYATAAIAPQVRRAYLRHAQRRTCEVAVPALAYFFRTDAAFARKEMQEFWAWLQGNDSHCGHDDERKLLLAIAAAGTSRGLEDAAIAALGGPDWRLAGVAAIMLAADGSARAETPLWAALEAWHARWAGRQALLSDEVPENESWDAYLAQRLRVALSNAVAWRLDDRDYARMMSLCLTPECKQDVAPRKEEILSPWIVYDFAPMFKKQRPYSVDSIAVPLHRLREKLGQYPPGTTFRWSAGSHWGVEREWFDDADTPLRHVERALPAGRHLSRR